MPEQNEISNELKSQWDRDAKELFTIQGYPSDYASLRYGYIKGREDEYVASWAEIKDLCTRLGESSLSLVEEIGDNVELRKQIDYWGAYKRLNPSLQLDEWEKWYNEFKGTKQSNTAASPTRKADYLPPSTGDAVPQDKLEVLKTIFWRARSFAFIKGLNGSKKDAFETWVEGKDNQSLISSLFSPAAQPTEETYHDKLNKMESQASGFSFNYVEPQPAKEPALSEDWEKGFDGLFTNEYPKGNIEFLKNWIKKYVPKVTVPGMRWRTDYPDMSNKTIYSPTARYAGGGKSSQSVVFQPDQFMYNGNIYPKEKWNEFELEWLDESQSLSQLIEQVRAENKRLIDLLRMAEKGRLGLRWRDVHLMVKEDSKAEFVENEWINYCKEHKIEQGAQVNDTTKSDSSNAFNNLKTLIQSQIDYWQSMIIQEVPGITSQASDYMAAYSQVLKWMEGK